MGFDITQGTQTTGFLYTLADGLPVVYTNSINLAAKGEGSEYFNEPTSESLSEFLESVVTEISIENGKLYATTKVAGKQSVGDIKGQDGQDGQDGKDGQDGADGVGISSIARTSTTGLVDTYTITFTNDTTTTFDVVNGLGTVKYEIETTNGVEQNDGSHILTLDDDVIVLNIFNNDGERVLFSAKYDEANKNVIYNLGQNKTVHLFKLVTLGLDGSDVNVASLYEAIGTVDAKAESNEASIKHITDNRLPSLSRSITNLSDKVSTNIAAISELKTTVDLLTVDDLYNRLEAVENTATTSSDAITTLKTDLSLMGNVVFNHKKELSSLNVSVSNASARAENAWNKANEISTNFNNNVDDRINAKINNLVPGTDFATVKATVEANSANISVLQDKQTAQESSINTLTGKVDDASSSVTSMEERLNVLPENFAELVATLKNYNGTLENLATEIETLAEDFGDQNDGVNIDIQAIKDQIYGTSSPININMYRPLGDAYNNNRYVQNDGYVDIPYKIKVGLNVQSTTIRIQWMHVTHQYPTTSIEGVFPQTISKLLYFSATAEQLGNDGRVYWYYGAAPFLANELDAEGRLHWTMNFQNSKEWGINAFCIGEA